MEADSRTRWIGLSGLASFACIAIAAAIAPPLWDAPGSTAAAETVAAYAQAHDTRLLISIFVYGVALGFFLCFAAALGACLRSLEAAPGIRSAIFLGSALVLVALILAGFAPGAVNTYRPQSPALAQALYDMTFALLAISGIPTATCLGAYASLVLPRVGVPLLRWTGWLALLGAVAHVVIAASFLVRDGFLSLEGEVIIAVPATFFAWILATSAVLLRRRQEARW